MNSSRNPPSDTALSDFRWSMAVASMSWRTAGEPFDELVHRKDGEPLIRQHRHLCRKTFAPSNRMIAEDKDVRPLKRSRQFTQGAYCAHRSWPSLRLPYLPGTDSLRFGQYGKALITQPFFNDELRLLEFLL